MALKRESGGLNEPRWYERGAEPDYRVSFANERTFLAWARTALAFLAAGVAMAEFATGLGGIMPRVLGGLLAAAGLGISLTAYPRWAANQRAVRMDEPLPRLATLPLVAAALVLVGLGAFIVAVGG